MTTVRDLIGDAMAEIGVRAAGEPIEPQAAADHLRTLNRMLDSWSTEDLLVYTIDRQLIQLVAGKQVYTLGTGGDFNVPRPVQIEMASMLINGVEIPLEILTDEQWRDMPVKVVPSTFPLAMWATGNFPLNDLWFWPIPAVVNTLVLYTWGQLNQFVSVNDVVSLPKGYEDALVSNLAMRLIPQYGLQPSPVLASIAQGSMARIKRMNWSPTYRSVDSSLSGSTNSMWRRSRGYAG